MSEKREKKRDFFFLFLGLKVAAFFKRRWIWRETRVDEFGEMWRGNKVENMILCIYIGWGLVLGYLQRKNEKKKVYFLGPLYP